jgi:P-type E1-E2 ATPase
VAFDKTGTLTKGELVVESVTAYGSFKKDEVLGLAASLEQGSNHLIARAVTAAAQSKNLRVKKARHIREAAGLGLEATVSGRKVLVGRAGFLEDNGIAVAAAKSGRGGKQSIVYVAADGALAGIISLADELRADAKTTLHWLDELGVKETLMITGDNQATANAIAKQLGISHVHAEALPADKLRVLDEIKQRPVAFVGDGVNDAPILTAADVGIALGARGSTAASESADMVIMQPDLIWVGAAMSIAKGTFRIAKQSILIGIALSVGLMIIFASGQFTPLAGAIVQEVVDVFVIFNALRAHLIKIDEEAA